MTKDYTDPEEALSDNSEGLVWAFQLLQYPFPETEKVWRGRYPLPEPARRMRALVPQKRHFNVTGCKSYQSIWLLQGILPPGIQAQEIKAAPSFPRRRVWHEALQSSYNPRCVMSGCSSPGQQNVSFYTTSEKRTFSSHLPQRHRWK